MFVNDLMYVNFEMIHPGDAFGRVMIENLEVFKIYYHFILFIRIVAVNS